MLESESGPTSLFLLGGRAAAAEDLELDLGEGHEGQCEAGAYSGEDYQEA